MESLVIAGTKSTPEIDFDLEANVLQIIGASYPESAVRFYEPVIRWIESFLETIDQEHVRMNIRIHYFNSSTSKIFMDLFDMLDEAVQKGRRIEVNWYYHVENDLARDYGEDFRIDLNALPFNLVEVGEQ